jgi:hypothetical protein
MKEKDVADLRHTLRDSGAPFVFKPGGWERSATSSGSALCTCGWRSGVLHNDVDRRRVHKDHVYDARILRLEEKLRDQAGRYCEMTNKFAELENRLNAVIDEGQRAQVKPTEPEPEIPELHTSCHGRIDADLNLFLLNAVCPSCTHMVMAHVMDSGCALCAITAHYLSTVRSGAEEKPKKVKKPKKRRGILNVGVLRELIADLPYQTPVKVDLGWLGTVDIIKCDNPKQSAVTLFSSDLSERNDGNCLS